MVNCPICSDAMNHEDHDGVVVDVCTKHGVWLDKSELFELTEAARHEPVPFWRDLVRTRRRPPHDERRTLGCPHCSAELRVEKYHGVHMDWCFDHGIWLDNGELAALLSNLRLDEAYVGRVVTRLFERRY